MKKWLALLLCALMVFSLTACGDVGEELEQGLQDVVQSVADEANKTVTRGQINGNVYTSDYSSLSFTKPDGWVFSTDEEIAASMNIGAELLDQSSYEQTLTTMMSVHDMMVTDPLTNSNLIVSYENLKMSNNESITEEKYFESVEQQLQMQTAMTTTVVGKSTVTLSGMTYHRMDLSVDYSGAALYQYYYVRKIGSYMSLVVVTLNDYSDVTIADVEAMFA